MQTKKEKETIEDVKLGFIFDLCPSGGKSLKHRDYQQTHAYRKHFLFTLVKKYKLPF